MKSNFEAQQEALLRQNKESIKDNPQVLKDAGTFMIKLSRRCRSCYYKILSSVKLGITIDDEWFEKNLCENCKKYKR